MNYEGERIDSRSPDRSVASPRDHSPVRLGPVYPAASPHAVLRNWFSGRQWDVFEARSTKEESQPPVRAKAGATLVQCRSKNHNYESRSR
jgi:hypothetical protein